MRLDFSSITSPAKQTRYDNINKQTKGQKSGLVVSKVDSQLEGFGFESHPILDENGVITMPGLISAPTSGSFNNWKEKKYRQPNGAHQKNIEKNENQALGWTLPKSKQIIQIFSSVTDV